MIRTPSPLGAPLLAAALVTLAGTVQAGDVPAAMQTRAGLYLDIEEAAAMTSDPDVIFVDVRTRAEVAFVGHPSAIDVHIPLMVMPPDPVYDAASGSYRMVPNPDFEMAFWDYADAAGIDEDTPIVLICRSGLRSARAADMLHDLGFETVYTIVGGFDGGEGSTGLARGWKAAGLAWTHALSPEQVYPYDRP
jgi:rhodanese-related sulfurtransferase